MKLYAPDYYPKFRCIAGKCKHSCCTGWEIDIDEQTLNRYRNTDGSFGNRLKNSIAQSDGTYYFDLCQNDRCPFLNSDNLCDIIINMGEDALCRICADHPRFRNWFSDRIEVGLGICCESAAELIVQNQEKVTMQLLEDDDADVLSEEDEYFLNLRQKYIDILQQRELTLEERFNKLLCIAGAKAVNKSAAEWAQIYLSLEHLDNEWVELIKILQTKTDAQLVLHPRWDLPFEQLAVYFIIRHLADGRSDMSLTERVAFAVLGTKFVSTVFLLCSDKNDLDSLADIARMYSSEIEYSEENLDALLDICAEYNFEV